MIKTFEEFSNKKEYKYMFYIPLIFKTGFDEDAFWNIYGLSWSLHDAIEKIGKKYGIWLEWMESEFRSYLRSGEYENKDEALEAFIKDVDFELEAKNFEPNEKRIKEYKEKMIDDFNKQDLLQYFDDDKELQSQIISMKMIDWSNNIKIPVTYQAEVEIISKTSLEINELEEIKNYLEGQCSDGWGEGFEQNEVGDEVYISTWSMEDWYEITFKELKN